MENAKSLHFPQFVGHTPQIEEIRQTIQKIGPKDIPVLITGEPGTGKDLIVQAIHSHSPRSNGPLVKINFGLFAEDLSPAGIFEGREKDSLERKKDQRIEEANGGTLFFDRIESLSPSLQTEFCHLLKGNPSKNLDVLWVKTKNMRLVFAVTTNLDKKNQADILKEFLLEKLKAIQINVPPLRERKADIPLFARSTANFNFRPKNKILRIPDEIVNLFLAYQWPGNVKELEDVIHRAITTGKWELLPNVYTRNRS